MSTIIHVPIFIDNDDIENGSRIILKQIRPDWVPEKVRYKVKFSNSLLIYVIYFILCSQFMLYVNL